MVKKFCKLLATGCGLGYSPIVPGTVGSLGGVLIYLLVYRLPLISYLFFVVTFTFLSVWIVAMALPEFEVKDPRSVVIDEIAGFLIVMTGLSFSWWTILLGFILFRLLDWLKPPPIRQLERVKGAWGIVLDDIAAGLFACGALVLIRYFIPSL